MKYTAREAAEFVGISASTLRRWANDGRVPYFWQNGIIMFRDEHLDKIIEYAQESKLQRAKMYKSTKKKVTLRAIGDFYRENILVKTGWVTLDAGGVRVFDNKGGKNNPPTYSRWRRIWTSEANKLISTISLPQGSVELRNYTDERQIDYSKCIECVDPTLLPEPPEREKKAVRHRVAVLAYFADGTTLRFESKSEAQEFFGLKRADDVTKYILSGHPLPDGTTTLDEALEESDIQAKRKKAR